MLTDPRLPDGKMLNADDTVWFRAVMPPAPNGQPYPATFEVRNGTGLKLYAGVKRDPNGPFLVQNASKSSVLILPHVSTGGELIYLAVRREAMTQTDVTVTLKTGLTCLRQGPLNRFELKCVDETGLDVWGGDEITLRLFVDGSDQPAFERSWTDVDTDEYQDLGRTEIWFARSCRVEVRETGDVDGDDVGGGEIPALVEGGPGDGPGGEGAVADMKVATGRYVLAGGRYRYGVGGA